MNEVLRYLLEVFLGLFSMALLLRFYLQVVRAPARNPLTQFLVALTDFIVRPTRRVVPGLWGYDLSTLLLAWLTQLLLVTCVQLLKGYQFGPGVGNSVAGLMLLSALNLVVRFIYILMVAVFAQAILSFVSPRAPAMPILWSMTRPFLRVFQRFIPPVGGVDLSPLFVLVLCQALLIWPLEPILRMLGA